LPREIHHLGKITTEREKQEGESSIRGKKTIRPRALGKREGRDLVGGRKEGEKGAKIISRDASNGNVEKRTGKYDKEREP